MRKLLAFILAVLLCFSMAPKSTFATNSEIVTNYAEFIEAFNSPDIMRIVIAGQIDIASGTNLNFFSKGIERHSEYRGSLFVVQPGNGITRFVFYLLMETVHLVADL